MAKTYSRSPGALAASSWGRTERTAGPCRRGPSARRASLAQPELRRRELPRSWRPAPAGRPLSGDQHQARQVRRPDRSAEAGGTGERGGNADHDRLHAFDLARHRPRPAGGADQPLRSEEHTSELQSLMRISYAVFCLKKKKNTKTTAA